MQGKQVGSAVLVVFLGLFTVHRAPFRLSSRIAQLSPRFPPGFSIT